MISIVCATRDIGRENDIISNIGANTGCEIVLVEGRNPSYQRNEGVKRTSGDIIYFIDDDSIIPEGILKKAGDVFASDDKIAAAGGPELTPSTDTVLQKVFGCVFASPWASGKSSARYSQKGLRRDSDEKELILCNMLVRRNVFEELGGFNEKIYPNEENEFLDRVKAAGYRMIYSPDIFIYRSKRKDIKLFMKQCFTYGRGRAEQSTVSFGLGDIINFVPAFFVLYLISVVLFGPSDGIPIIIYFIGTGYFSLKIWRELKSNVSFFTAFLSFFLLHVCYGAGSIYGIFTGLNLKEKQADHNINIKKI